MPIHEYECSACGNVFERLQKLSEADPTDCPRCGTPRLRRRISAPSFRLAGGGWYETDFKGKGEAKHNLASSDEAPRPASGDGDKSKAPGGEQAAAATKPAAAESAPASTAGAS